MRFHALGARSFWFDEGMSVGIARLDWYNFARILWRREGNMSLYYLLLRGWLHFGSSEAFIRSLSVIFALATVPALYFLGRYLFGPRVGLIAAALLSVNEPHMRYSQEARSYSLLVLLCTLSSLYFLRSLQEPSRWRHVLTSVLSVYAHFYAVLVLAAQWISMGLLDPGCLLPRKGSSWRLIALLLLPVAAFVAATGAGPLNWLKRPGSDELWATAIQLTGDGPLLVAAYALACLIALVPVLRSITIPRVSWNVWRYRFLFLWLLLPPAFILLVSFLRPLFLPRYFILCLPALLLLTASSLSRLRSAWTAVPVLLLFCGLSLNGVVAYFHQKPNDDWRAISGAVLKASEPGDGLVFYIGMGRIPYEYYHSRWPTPASAPVVLHPATNADHITFLDFVTKPDYARLAQSLPQHRRVWFVLSHAGDQPMAEPTAATLLTMLRGSFPKVTQQTVGDCIVFLFTKN